MRVLTDRNLCLGAGQCVKTAAQVFDQDDHALVELRMSLIPEALQAAVREAVLLCPSGAISVGED